MVKTMRKAVSKAAQKKNASLGGKAVKKKATPDKCPRCGETMAGRKWHSYLGHLGLHGLADHHFSGDMQKAQERLRSNSLAKQDPAPWNNAWPKYRPILVDLPEALDAPPYPVDVAE